MKRLSVQRASFAGLVLSLAFGVCERPTLYAQKRRSVTDDAIVDYVKLKLAGDPIVKGGALQVDCKEGVVTLSGNVDTSKQKARAGRLAKKVKGVKQVINNLVVKHR